VTQVFPRWFDALSRAAIVGTALAVAGASVALAVFYRSDYVTAARSATPQTVPFSHAHHVGKLGIDCRYCHTSVESASFAGIPATETCMHCHEQIWVGAETLAPIRDSWKTGNPLHWRRVHSLPGFVYFDHSIHVAKGVGCVECHGRVDRMPLTWQEKPLTMVWCLECHRHPEAHLRPRGEVFNLAWSRGPSDPDGATLAKEFRIKDERALTSCSTCHR
jgi:hypothetical protein